MPSAPTPLELAMQASVDEVLGGTKSSGVPRVSVQGAIDAQRRPMATKRTQEEELAARQAEEFERQLEAEAEEASNGLFLGAHAGRGPGAAPAAASAHSVDDDDEFGFDPVDPSTVSVPVPNSATHLSTMASGVAADSFVGTPAAPSGELEEHAQAPTPADVSDAGERTEAERRAEILGGGAEALRSLRAAASAEESAVPAVVHEAKSAAEKADDLAASLRSNNLNLIQEDEEEEDTEGEEEDDQQGAGAAKAGGSGAGQMAGVKAGEEGGHGAQQNPGGAATGTVLGTAPTTLAPGPAPAPPPAPRDDPAAAQRRAREEAERAAAEAQWAAVEETSAREAERSAQRAANGGGAGGRLGPKVRGDKIGFAEALAHLQEDSSLVAAHEGEIVREDWSGAPCLPRLVPFLRARLKDDRLRGERDLLMCAAKVSLDDGDDVHDRMLMTIFKALTGNARDPPRRGGHWDLIGFQGADPATDLRGVGILSLLNGLYLVTRRRAEAQRLYALSRGDRDFPFMTVSINVTKICLEALRCGALTPAANARGSVVEAFHCLHAALYSHMGDQWQARQLTIRDFGHLLKELEAQGTKHTGALLKKDAAKQAGAARPGAAAAEGAQPGAGGVELGAV
mmetsp:Transcript_27853/g.81866  ORF Transcript_27853/g.81866 Transcript_27853/m.81866 type:complete len:626 (+) Transcript_27853:108-1985(+)|eukprot:CAMPEP_0206037168 /NCGR_PEP_ID=MMETSP1466-20131121/3277_1 /ASSEMBLY_ACC=CAM_ASM_001126 /TAXON_ID=44452 /ORGANISM="Pavlova gyrans, Strain CCMP608" /LENGTH=625 /DNA_ID=CAMNT_0053411709 /DNA_START=93 /DNA_END=1970 /DNA_ORIENTATION=+